MVVVYDSGHVQTLVVSGEEGKIVLKGGGETWDLQDQPLKNRCVWREEASGEV